MSFPEPERSRVRRWLAEEDPVRLLELWTRADQIRAMTVGHQVHLRGLVEISNHCVRSCRYCGLGSFNRDLPRYRMTLEEILECARRAQELGMGTVVLQAGEDLELTGEIVARTIRAIKTETSLAVTLSLGERSPEDLGTWRDAGADRYLLRFETSDQRLYRGIHPARGTDKVGRMDLLNRLRDLGYEVGSGVMVGLPGQSTESLVRDLEIFEELDLDMIGIGPYVPHPRTPLGNERGQEDALMGVLSPCERVLLTMKMVALARISCPEANIPATTALSTIDPDSLAVCLSRGANVVMPNLTPLEARFRYEVYPGMARTEEVEEGSISDLADLLAKSGRSLGVGAGGRTRRRFPCRDAVG